MLDQFALETEARIAPLINEKRRLFNDMLTAKGTVLCELSLLDFFLLLLFSFSIGFCNKINPLSLDQLLGAALLTYSVCSGNIRVVCRTRPLFEDEGPSIVEYPDDYTVRVNTGDDSIPNSKKNFEFDRVYGPHVGQGYYTSTLMILTVM